MVPAVTTPKKRGGRGRGRRSRKTAPATPAAVAVEAAAETPLDTFLEQPPAALAPEAGEPAEPAELPETTSPEPGFAARMPPPEPERPRPSVRRAIFFDVENSSRSDHVVRVLAYLDVDRVTRATELVAVGNWRVINHETARLLAKQGAQLVHSAPSVGVRDWSDLRIAVAAGVWLAAARPGDAIEIVSDDQAFDAVGDVATSLGVVFRRLSYRALAGLGAAPVIEEPVKEPRSRRRRRRGGRRESSARHPAVEMPAPAANGVEPDAEGAHTAPHDELLAVARELLDRAPERTVSIDALSNALKAHGFRRTPGSPRLITRLRRIKELEVSRTGAIRLVDGGSSGEGIPEPDVGAPDAEASNASDAAAPAPDAPPRRRRRRGGRRRRGRGNSPATVASP